MTIHRLLVFLIGLACLNSLPVSAETEEVYRFERLWPVLQQPWYFDGIWDIAVSQQRHVYLVDYGHSRVSKLTLGGQLISHFGTRDGFNPTSIAVDSEENVYVRYRDAQIPKQKSPVIGKFNGKGELISDEWAKGSPCVENIRDIAVDNEDNVYIVGEGVQKCSSQGELLDNWSVNPLTNLDNLKIAIGDNSVYLLEYQNHRVQKYTTTGTFLTSWGSRGNEPGNFNYPENIAIDSQDNIYVTDKNNHRIQKFTSEGFLMEWRGDESKITNLSEISQCPLLSAIIHQDPAENKLLSIFNVDDILDSFLQQPFSTEDTEDILTFSIGKNDIVSFLLNHNNPRGIAVDLQDEDNVYVTYSFPDHITKYTSKGQLLSLWASYGNSQERFNTPAQIARGKSGNLYVTDMLNHRVLKLTAEGRFIKQWGELGCSNGQFFFPFGIAVDTEENIYVVDSGNGSIQKFSAEGQFLTQWGKLDYLNMSERDFLFATSIAVDKNNHVYVVDSFKRHIKKFTSEGTFIKTFGDSKVFNLPISITVDNNDNVYVIDIYDHNLKKFTTEGKFINEFGKQGHEKGLFYFPSNVATDNDGNIYISDSNNHRIQKLTSDGELITKWGEFGTNPGQFSKPIGLAVSPDGDRVYVVEPVNNRIQVFNQTRYDVGKAIIVAGGTDKKDNLWDATQMVSHFAYRALVYQGFTKDSIYYLNDNDQIDLDNNGVDDDDVDAKSTKENLEYAITQWAKDTDNLTIYLTDHGGDNKFQINSEQTLTADDLNNWLKTLQADKTGSIKIIYDACQSGSFLSHFVPPEGKNRIVITSAEASQNAYFSNDGSLSFSGHFWQNVLYGANIENAFKQASTAVDYLQSTQTEQKQTPQLDSNGNNVANEPDDYTQVQDKWIGNGTFTPRGAPVIDSVSQPQTIKDTHTATVTVTVSDDKGIARVWALVRKPRDLERVVAAETITALPSFDLQPVSDNQYEGSYSGFDRAGSYELAIFALDNDGNISQPKTTTVFVETAFQRRAIIVGGHLPPAIQNIGQAYDALRYQAYRDDDIYYLSNTSRLGVDVLTTLDNVKFALTTWAKENTQDIVIYLEGWGNDTMFRLNETETLPFSQLDTWLDTLQQNIPGAVTVIYEGPQSGHLIAALTPPTGKTRIVISSTGTEEKECTNTESLELFFSQHFWQTVLNGAKNLSDAFDTAQRNVRSLINKQCPGCDFKQKQKYFPQLEANGNGIGNETEDSDIAKQQSIGIGIITAGTEPVINQALISPDAILTGDTTATLQVENITTPDKINRVWAVITPPCHSSDATATTVELEQEGENHYQVNYEGFRHEGRYQVAIYAEDNKGRRSLPKIIYVHQQWLLKPSQAIYQEGDNIQVRLPSPPLKGDTQYLAVRLPDDNLFVIKGLNEFVPFDAAAIPAWAGNGEVVVDNIQVTSDFPPKGKYQFYLLRIPKGTALDLTSESQILRESSCYVE
jgi:sugar lactone lactonase YvrE